VWAWIWNSSGRRNTGGHPLEDPLGGVDGGFGDPVLSLLSSPHFAAVHVCYELVAVAEAQDGEAGLQYSFAEPRGVSEPEACGAPGEDDPLQVHDALQGFEFLRGCVAWEDLGVDAHLPDPAGDEVAVLAAEV